MKKTIAGILLSMLIGGSPFLNSQLFAADTETADAVSAESADYILNMAFFHYGNMEFEKAAGLFEKYLEITGDSEVPLMQLGKINLELKQFEIAKKYFQRALGINSKNTDTLAYLSNIAIGEDDLEKAVSYLEAIVELDPVNERSLYMLAQIYEQKKDKRKAIVYYRKLAIATRKNSSNIKFLTSSYNKIARYYTEAQDYEKAMEYYKKIVELNPQESNSIFIYGELLKLNGKFRESAEVMIDLLRLNPGNESILESLVESLFIIDDYRTRAYLNSYFENSSQPKYLFQVMKKQYQNNGRNLIGDFQKILKSNPNRISVHIGILRCYDLKSSLSNPDEIEDLKKMVYTIIVLAQRIKAYDIAASYMGHIFDILDAQSAGLNKGNIREIDPKNTLDRQKEKLLLEYIDAYYTHAVSLENLKKLRQATVYILDAWQMLNSLINYYRTNYSLDNQLHYESRLFQDDSFDYVQAHHDSHNELQALTRKKTDIMLNLNWLLIRQLETTSHDVSWYVEEALRANPDDHRGYYLAGLYYQEHGRLNKDNREDYAKAQNYLNRAISSFKKSNGEGEPPAAYHFYAGLVSDKLGDFTTMEENLLKAISQDPYNGMYLNFLGYMYSLNNVNLEKAFELVRGALEDEPENAAYLDTLGWIYFKMNRYEEALGQLLVARSMTEKEASEDPVISFHIAETYGKLGKNKQALFFYRNSLEHISRASEPLDMKYIEGKIHEYSE